MMAKEYPEKRSGERSVDSKFQIQLQVDEGGYWMPKTV